VIVKQRIFEMTLTVKKVQEGKQVSHEKRECELNGIERGRKID